MTILVASSNHTFFGYGRITQEELRKQQEKMQKEKEEALHQQRSILTRQGDEQLTNAMSEMRAEMSLSLSDQQTKVGP